LSFDISFKKGRIATTALSAIVAEGKATVAESVTEPKELEALGTAREDLGALATTAGKADTAAGESVGDDKVGRASIGEASVAASGLLVAGRLLAVVLVVAAGTSATAEGLVTAAEVLLVPAATKTDPVLKLISDFNLGKELWNILDCFSLAFRIFLSFLCQLLHKATCALSQTKFSQQLLVPHNVSFSLLPIF